MARRALPIRILVVVLAMLQVALPGIGAIADGRVAVAAAAGQYAHVEESSSATCPVAHAPDCAVCRFLSAGAMGCDVAPGALLLGDAGAVAEAPPEPVATAAVRLPDARGPPAA